MNKNHLDFFVTCDIIIDILLFIIIQILVIPHPNLVSIEEWKH